MADNGYVFWKDNNHFIVYKYNEQDKNLLEMKEKLGINWEYEVSLNFTSENSLKATYKNIKQLLNSNDSVNKEQKLKNLIKNSLNQSWKIILKGPEIWKEIQLNGNCDNLEEVKGECDINQEFDEEELKIQMSKTLINKKDMKNIEDFDMYESLIQGQTLYQPSFLINPNREEVKEEHVFDIDFEKPLSLFCLKLELTFDANTTQLKKLLPKEIKEETKSIEHENFDENNISSQQKIENSKSTSKIEIDSHDEKWIPLIVHSHKGGAFNANSQISKLVSDDKRAFAANYAGSHYIFSHQFGRRFIIDQYIVMSDNSSQIGAYPMGSGILFISDTLAGLENTEPFHSFTFEEYLEWKNKRMYDPRPLQPYEPIGYFEFGSSTKIINKISSKTSWRYIKLVPTAFK